MQVAIRGTVEADREQIEGIHAELNRPHRGHLNMSEFLIAQVDELAIGCAALTVHHDGAYFYGLAVRRAWQRKGVGGRLMQARIDALPLTGVDYAIALVMFWNSRFFRRFMFVPIKRKDIPESAAGHSDLVNPVFRRSAVMLRSPR